MPTKLSACREYQGGDTVLEVTIEISREWDVPTKNIRSPLLQKKDQETK